jgi:hypothetical protein
MAATFPPFAASERCVTATVRFSQIRSKCP